MEHSLPLITTLVGSLLMAFVFGMLAHRLKLSPMVGYLLAGVLVGPFTPGYVADADIAPELAELGVILLMFGVGLHFSLRDLMAVKRIAVPGAIVQIAIATLLGALLATLLGWSPLAATLFGLSLSVASTVVLLRALEARNMVDSPEGKIAVGWLIVEDLVMVLALVLLPLLANLSSEDGQGASWGHLLSEVAWTLGKVATFITLMVVFGRRFIPWLLARSAATGSRELFTLAVLAIALGIAFGAVELFDVSFALGAFFAGIVLNGSELSHKAANDSLPLRDAFAVLFFVSVGMLFNPAILLTAPLAVLASVIIILFGKSLAAYGIVRLFGHDRHTALTISASLAQIGEFSFILLGLGITLGLLPNEARDIVLAGAILSILVNPFLFNLIDRLEAAKRISEEGDTPPRQSVPADKVVLVGGGRIGSRIAEQLRSARVPLVIVESDPGQTERLREQGFEVMHGNAVLPDTLSAAGIEEACVLIVAIPNSFEAGEIIAHQRMLAPERTILACAYFGDEVEWLLKQGATSVVNGADEVANRLVSQLPDHRRGQPATSPGATH
ncbi:YbaL family putative K(+) efflux transporter [Pseudaeromonas sharmana]|uniref:YbaL family putative K(+) efflux transporter n=1 Tax=Pseudaeromonas sharmana TaxID=328412 RepID=A0ABV8CLW6_9GAMM